jgi:hypothetical protein
METKTRNRGAFGYVPTPSEIILARGNLSQAKCASLIYTTQVRWSNYENGKSRIHPAMWELFLEKRKRLSNDVL